MFRFTVRDLLWLMALAAVCCAWWLEHQLAAGYKRELETATATWAKRLPAEGP